MVILCQHVLSHRSLSEKHRGDQAVLYLQEIASHDPKELPHALESKKRGPELVTLGLRVTPVAHVRAQKASLPRLGGAQQPPYLEVDLQESVEQGVWVLVPPTSCRTADWLHCR